MSEPTDAGVLTTATDVLFSGGREGYFFALDARDGKLLWKAPRVWTPGIERLLPFEPSQRIKGPRAWSYGRIATAAGCPNRKNRCDFLQGKPNEQNYGLQRPVPFSRTAIQAPEDHDQV
jgi:hypothetical protein